MKSPSVPFLRLLVVLITLTISSRAIAQISQKVLHSFSGGADGQQPYAGLVQGSDGALYGTTYMGGSNNVGTVFKVNPDGSGNTPIFHFPGSDVNPFGLAYPSGLIQGTDGGLYGTTGFGGSNGFGSVFRINTDGSGYQVLHSFAPPGGYEPAAALVQDRTGMLYGTTQGGGLGFGTVFKVSTNGTGYVSLYAFGAKAADPQSPQAPLIQAADGALYGTASAGGASAVGGASGYGAVYKVNSDGSGATVLHSFLPGGTDGLRPYGGLVQSRDGALYGTTQEGGSDGLGTVFKLNPDGSGYAVVHSFNPGDADGKYPNSALVTGADGALYGTTEMGGAKNLGVVFRLGSDRSDYSVLYTFGSNPGDGGNPKAPLIRASDGGLFGTAQFGGDKNYGTIFRLGPAPAVISSIKPNPNKTVQISLTSAPHFEYRIEASSDQVHWAILTNLNNTTGTMQFTDPDSATIPQRFYRAAWVP